MEGKQYGLIMPKKVQLSAPKAGNIFGDDHDSDTEDGIDWVKKSLKAEGEKNRMKKQTKLDIQRALNDDPTIYQYDEIYDDMEKKEAQSKINDKKEIKKPKYIHELLKAADRRKREQEHRIERMVQKEREAEGEMFADKESFVTSAYKAKLEEFKKMEEEEERMDRLESIGDVTKQQDMSGFYRQLFAQTVDTPKDKIVDVDSNSKTTPQSSNKDGKNVTSSSASSSSAAAAAEGSDVDSADSDDGNQHHNISNIKLKIKRSRQYRQRVIETSDVESEIENDNDEKICDKSPDNNCNKSNEECELPKKKTKLSSDEHEKCIINNVINDELKCHVIEVKEKKSPIKDENINVNVMNVNEIKCEEKKISIWEKRTVGDVFDAALQRYYNRKSMRISGC